MTEYKRTLSQEPLTAFPKRYVPQKRWKLTRSDNQDPVRVTRNFVIDQGFMFLLGRVKALYQGSGMEAFERDLRNDRSFTAVGMHAFITPDLRLELECNYDLECCVTYDFEGCEHEAQILNWIQGSDSIRKCSQHQPTKGGLKAAFDRLKLLHPAECFSLL